MAETMGGGVQKKNEWAQCHCLHDTLNTTSFGTPRMPSENIQSQHSIKRQTEQAFANSIVIVMSVTRKVTLRFFFGGGDNRSRRKNSLTSWPSVILTTKLLIIYAKLYLLVSVTPQTLFCLLGENNQTFRGNRRASPLLNNTAFLKMCQNV